MGEGVFGGAQGPDLDRLAQAGGGDGGGEGLQRLGVQLATVAGDGVGQDRVEGQVQDPVGHAGVGGVGHRRLLSFGRMIGPVGGVLPGQAGLRAQGVPGQGGAKAIWDGDFDDRE